ncbi:SLOB protein kinase [Aphanomyces invadans]|uniref:SLOB protein kinase n=1 Tax=Aphanomyces invadans TaxID=157072 RepID=A0A024UMI1_9STRA|nr:SLOB protein kinase [Aphanomyces invadans]ETW07062.1 SLOB protein kinase [Aphanomyces invadans]|eukprot:XP_008865137.1 SLOB protein kinase [Aphanomyces invadans]
MVVRRLHGMQGMNVWYAITMAVCGCLGLLMLGFISYWCFKLRQDKRRRSAIIMSARGGMHESSHLLQRASLDWPSSLTSATLPMSSSSTSLYLSPIPEELRSMCSEDDEFDEANRDKEFVRDFCERSDEYLWLDKPALYMGKDRSKRMYLLGRASLSHLTSARFGLMGDRGRFTQLLCSIFPTTALQDKDVPVLRAYFHYVHDTCPHVLPVLDIQLMAPTNKILVVTPYVPQGSLKDYIYHRCKTAMVQIPYHLKYKRHGCGTPLGHSTLARYGRDILLGMQELQHAGLPYHQLHSGNVLLHGDQATLSGYEAVFFQRSPPTTQVETPVKLFGQLFFEMVFGVEWSPSRLNPNGTVSFGSYQPPTDVVRDVFNAIFQPFQHTASIESLLALPLFQKDPVPRLHRSFARRDPFRVDSGTSLPDTTKPKLPQDMETLVQAALDWSNPQQDPMLSHHHVVVQAA